MGDERKGNDPRRAGKAGGRGGDDRRRDDGGTRDGQGAVSGRPSGSSKANGGEGRSRSRRGRRRGGRRRGGQRRTEQTAAAQESPREAPRPGTLVTLLARAGVGSRRSCDEIVRAGRVTINGETVDFPRQKVSPDDTVAVDGEVVDAKPLRYLLLNKPRGVASTRSDPHADRPVVDLVPDGRTLFPVGRLDVDTTGLIILTNDGRLANRLMHPRYGVPKRYVARVRGRAGRRSLTSLRAGVELEDGVTAPAEARLVKQAAKTALVELTIHQGRKRQVRRMFAALDLPVEELHRDRYGPLTDEGLKVGAWRELSGDELDALQKAAEHVDECVADEPLEEAVYLAEAPAPSAAEPSEPEAAELPPPSSAEPSASDETDTRGPADDVEAAGGEPPADEADERPDDA